MSLIFARGFLISGMDAKPPSAFITSLHLFLCFQFSIFKATLGMRSAGSRRNGGRKRSASGGYSPGARGCQNLINPNLI